MPASTRSRSEAGGAIGDGVGQQGGGLAEAGHLGLAVLALGEVPLEPGALEVVERVDGVGAGQRVDVGHDATPIVSRSRMSPSRIRVLAVPTGRSSMLATSVWV